ncbi:2-amino-4-hydroxy-6-hydroxymethyldihydropteridine diphosphokinase [Maribrevibacterium harenarium]|uniref:2-amino-4-hydroxy-6-hydroxymethyldihydropteridine pyrophosphokinase n=1 Tax=Maribrevibacterium harenarium TaxID=2589817 RepID=A0A501WN56_9GAMM|nr:2-amino-4-hydroxy-6-hydroxymethyldihydropteridine diphosphokinase [Maribrevibacterium harenarium]TPE49634.1 2-amino-4-hydroxy-6-hydroxymethyldihydropteridine diphosphokinase [Maribrevibacterium harenarium]
MNLVYIGLGSNLDTPVQQLQTALTFLAQHPEIQQLEVSALYRSKPVGPQDQPDFVNAVARFATMLSAEETLDLLQAIEQDHRRVRERHWGPRTLDLDILLFNDDIIASERLTVPHAFMLERGFVIRPLLDIAPELLLSNGKTVAEHLQQLDTSDLVSIATE